MKWYLWMIKLSITVTTENMSTNSPEGWHGIDIFLDKIHCFKLPFKAKMGFPGGSEVNNPPFV